MKIYQLNREHPPYKPLREVADIVLGGGVMVYPTDTIYGIGCDAFSKKAIERISAIKKRDPLKPFSFVCEDVGKISEIAFVPNWAYRLMNRLLPGPYTFILESRKTGLPKKMLGKRNAVGVRVPASEICHALIKLIGRPIVSTSVNLAGMDPLTTPDMLPEKFSNYIDAVINIGPLISDPSTVIDLTGDEPEIIRKGKGEFPA